MAVPLSPSLLFRSWPTGARPARLQTHAPCRLKAEGGLLGCECVCYTRASDRTCRCTDSLSASCRACDPVLLVPLLLPLPMNSGDWVRALLVSAPLSGPVEGLQSDPCVHLGFWFQPDRSLRVTGPDAFAQGLRSDVLTRGWFFPA